MSNIPLALIGYACDLGGTVSGSRDGPSILRSLGLVENLEKLGYSVEDYGDVSADVTSNSPSIASASKEERPIKNLQQLHGALSKLASLSEQAVNEERFPLMIGGDHSLSIGGVAGVTNAYQKRSKKLGLIWVDTHPDLNIPENSPSKCAFGMSTAVLLGKIPGMLSSLQENSPAIAAENTVYVGLRDIDQGEREMLKNSALTSFTIRDVDIHGMYKVAERAIERASNNTDGFIVSFDLDVCDPRLVPGTGTPYRGGLTFREVHLLVECLHLSQLMRGFELVELNPILDKNFQTANLALSLIESALGDEIL